jgi:hypothetical protein
MAAGATSQPELLPEEYEDRDEAVVQARDTPEVFCVCGGISPCAPQLARSNLEDPWPKSTEAIAAQDKEQPVDGPHSSAPVIFQAMGGVLVEGLQWGL